MTNIDFHRVSRVVQLYGVRVSRECIRREKGLPYGRRRVRRALSSTKETAESFRDAVYFAPRK